MDERDADKTTAILPPLLRALEILGLLARHLDPFDLDGLAAAVGTHDADLRAARLRLDASSGRFARLHGIMAASSDAALAAFDDLRAAPTGANALFAIFRALRHVPRAHEALYPLARDVPAIDGFFLDPSCRGDDEMRRRLAAAKARDDTGIMHVANGREERGGYSLYVPEYCDAASPMPLIVALHGGSGHGRDFLWSWLRQARSSGAVLVAPTATGNTWAIQGTDTDTPNLLRILDRIRGRWRIDPARVLLTGLSDGGTFCYLSGLEGDAPFTHLAPVAAAFHPMMTEFADGTRLAGLPIHIVHGARDWMFPPSMARQAQQLLSAAGARVTYREIPDLSHTYPPEENIPILDWLSRTA